MMVALVLAPAPALANVVAIDVRVLTQLFRDVPLKRDLDPDLQASSLIEAMGDVVAAVNFGGGNAEWVDENCVVTTIALTRSG